MQVATNTDKYAAMHDSSPFSVEPNLRKLWCQGILLAQAQLNLTALWVHKVRQEIKKI
ncbi:MAG: hypothetical protein HOE45_06255 [Gammaproteobacteria bacterium]|nr:hypothetical protein [Gammaproteobacteria bacterium]